MTTLTTMTITTTTTTLTPSTNSKPFALPPSHLPRRLWGFVSGSRFPHLSLIGIIGLAVGGWPIYKEAFENLAARRMTMELSMTIAIVAAAAISEFFTALIITLFVLVAEVLEGATVARGRRAIRSLLDFLPHAVAVRRNGAITEVNADTLAVGDAVLVNPGGSYSGRRYGVGRPFIRGPGAHHGRVAAPSKRWQATACTPGR